MEKNMHILIVDDNLKNLQVAGGILKEQGFKLSLAQGWEDVSKILENIIPNLILLDVMMPEVDGFEVCKRLKKDDHTKEIPVIFLTAKTETEDIIDGFNAGGVDYINKPFRKEELIARVNCQIKLQIAKEELKESLQQSDKLLLNVFPKSIVNELKEKGSSPPKHYDNVTIFVSDFVNFTEISTKLKPIQLIDSLNIMYTKFDEIMLNNNCERIKTIGDAFFAVSGIPEKKEKHADNIVNAALQILEYMNSKPKDNGVKWEIRIGINTGEVIGGIVGVEKYIYDVFGDSVNTAFRLEASAEKNSINLSKSTYKNLNGEYIIHKEISAELKGKGLVESYILK